jgi:hypothetical protein
MDWMPSPGGWIWCKGLTQHSLLVLGGHGPQYLDTREQESPECFGPAQLPVQLGTGLVLVALGDSTELVHSLAQNWRYENHCGASPDGV